MVMGDTRAVNGTNGNKTILKVKADSAKYCRDFRNRRPRGTNITQSARITIENVPSCKPWIC